MPVLMRQDQRFDSSGPVFDRLSESGGRGALQNGLTVGQPATIEHFEPLAAERPSGTVEIARAGVCFGHERGAALLEVCAQHVQVFRRDDLPEFGVRHLQIRPVEALRPRRDDDPERPRRQAAEQRMLPLEERHESVRAGLRRNVQQHEATVRIDTDWVLVLEEIRLERQPLRLVVGGR